MTHQVPPIQFFQQELEKRFRFLTDEFGLARVYDQSVEVRAIFQNDELDLWIGNDRGSYDAIFWLKKNVHWLLPSESRMFLLNESCACLHRKSFEASSLKCATES